MRKIFVVLLVLAIAGGAWAQEGESTWGSLTGEAKIQTVIDFYGNDGYDGDAWIGGGQTGDMYLRLNWEYIKGDWTINLPFEIEGGNFGTNDGDDGTYSGIKYNPDGGPLTVEIPFELQFTQDPDGFWQVVQNVNASATYDGGDYWFKFGFDDLFGRDGGVKIGAIGGWYQWDIGKLAVSYNGATDSDWWKVSDIVHSANVFGSYAWENIGGDHSSYGIGFNLSLSDEMTAGIAFGGNTGKGEAGEAMFTDDEAPYTWNLMYDFLPNFIVGMKYDGEVSDGFNLGVSFKFGMWSIRDAARPTELDVRLPLHFGVKVGFDPIEVKFDISALFDKEHVNNNIAAYFNLGFQFQFGDSGATDGFWARLLLKGLDLGNYQYAWSDKKNDAFKYNPVFTPELWVAFQRSANDDNGEFGKFDGKGDGIWFALYAAFPDLIVDYDPDFAIAFNTKLGIGYNGLAIIEDKLIFGIGAFVGINIPGGAQPKDADKALVTGSFSVEPDLTWKVFEKSEIVFAYSLGMSDFYEGELDINKFTTSFKWFL